jgi:hypothetical protein
MYAFDNYVRYFLVHWILHLNLTATSRRDQSAPPQT